MENYQLLVLWSTEANEYQHNATSTKEMTANFFTKEVIAYKKTWDSEDSHLIKGHDWDIITFDTEAERSAYIKGAQAANGWESPSFGLVEHLQILN